MTRLPTIAFRALLWILPVALAWSDETKRADATTSTVSPRDTAPIVIVADGQQPSPVALALGDLERAMKQRGFAPRRQPLLPDGNSTALVVGIAGSSAAVDRLLREEHIELPREEESLCIRHV